MHSPLEPNSTEGVLRPAVIQGLSPQAIDRGPRGPALSATPDALSLLKALRRRLGLALGLGIMLGAIGGIAVYFLLPPSEYTATAILRVARTPPRILTPINGEGRDDFKIYLRTQKAWIMSRLILKAVVNDPRVAKLPTIKEQFDPIEWLGEHLEVEYAEDSEILQISLSGYDPIAPVEIVNAVTRAYQKEVVDKERNEILLRLNMLKEIQVRYQKSLEDRRRALTLLSERTGSGDKDTLVLLQQFSMSRLAAAETELAEVQGELRKAKVEFEVQKKAAEGRGAPGGDARAEVPEYLVDQQIDLDPHVAQLTQRIAQARAAYESAQRIVKNQGDPSLKRPLDMYRAAWQTLASYRQRLRPIVRERLLREAQPGRVNGVSTVTLSEERVAILEKLEELILKDVEKYKGHEREFKQTSVAILAIQDEIANTDAAAKQVGAKIESLMVELSAPPRVELIQDAERPNLKDETRKIKMVGMASAGLFIFGLLGVSYLEFRSHKIETTTEVATKLGLRIVGALPALPSGRGRPGQVREDRWHNLLIESIDSTRTSLLHASHAESLRMLMVTSAVGGEGKTTLASHLATSLARAGRRTLLLDGDLRSPSIHRLFGLEPGPGLSEMLRGEAEPAGTIQATTAHNLWVLPAGQCDGEAIQRLAQDDIRAILAGLRADFDFVIVDAPPVLPIADALLIGQYVDAVVFSILREVSRLPKVYAACERVSAHGIRTLGAIVTGVDGELYGSGRYYSART